MRKLAIQTKDELARTLKDAYWKWGSIAMPENALKTVVALAENGKDDN